MWLYEHQLAVLSRFTICWNRTFRGLFVLSFCVFVLKFLMYRGFFVIERVRSLPLSVCTLRSLLILPAFRDFLCARMRNKFLLQTSLFNENSGSIPRIACVACKTYLCVTTKKVWLSDRQTADGNRQTDPGQSDPYMPQCFAGDTKN